MWLKKRGRIFHYRFTLNGHEFTGSTRATDLATARLVLEQIRKETVLGEHGIRKAPSLQAVAEAWAHAKRGVASPKHLKASTYALEALEPLAKVALDRLSTERVEEWRARYLDGHKPASANLVLRYLKAWCRWAMTAGYLSRMPYDLKPMKWQAAPRAVLKPEQVLAFLAAVDAGNSRGDQIRAAVRVMLATGMREAEVLGMRWEWLDLEAACYTVGKAKGKRGRVLPVPAWALDALKALPRTVTGLVFPAADGKPHRMGWLRKAIERGAAEVKLNGLGAHRLRASFATLHHAAGTPLADLQGMLGHEDIATTRGYVEEDLDRKRSAQEKLAKRMGLA